MPKSAAQATNRSISADGRASSTFGRRIVYACLVIAITCALILIVQGVACSECVSAESLQPLPALKWMGLFAYSGLLLAFALSGWNSWTTGAVFLIFGIHICLVGCLTYYQIFCSPCLVCGACIATVCLIGITEKAVRIRNAVITTVVGVLFYCAASSISWHFEKVRKESAARQAVNFNHLRRLPGSRLTLYAFTARECPNCIEFEKNDLKAIRDTFGTDVTVCLYDAPQELRSAPVLVLAGRDKKIIVGRPRRTDNLLKRISENLVSRSDIERETRLPKTNSQGQ